MSRFSSLIALTSFSAAAAAVPLTLASASAALASLDRSPIGSALASLGRTILSARPAAVWAAHAAAPAPPSLDSVYCPDAGAFDLVPLSVANLSATSPSVTWSGDGCFTTLTATLSFSASGAATVSLSGSSPLTPLCGDVYLVAHSYALSLPVELSALSPHANLSFLSWSADDAADVRLRGIHVGLLPCGVLNSISSLLATVNIFSPLSGNIADLVDTNRAFLNGRGVWAGPTGGNSPLLPFGRVQSIDASLIRSGDYFAILRYDGLDPMIAFGTGFGATGHSAVALWKGSGPSRELYVIEDTDRDPFGPAVYFGSGAIVTPYTTWISLARNASYQVSLLPLAPSFSSSFDEDAVWRWFEGDGTTKGVEGSPYGYSNFLFSVLDRGEGFPMRSLPHPIDAGMLMPILNTADILLGPAPANETLTSLTVDTLLVRGLNKRLGTACSSFACILSKVNANMAAGVAPASALEAAAIPEDDAWRYDGSVAFVCSAFAAAAWKAGLNASGLLPAHFVATEQTPIDNVRLAIFDASYWTMSNCPVGLWTPTDGKGSVCQLMGTDRMPLNLFNTVGLYDHMNERCGNAWPAYTRCDGADEACAC